MILVRTREGRAPSRPCAKAVATKRDPPGDLRTRTWTSRAHGRAALLRGRAQADAQKRVDGDGVIVADLPRADVWNVGTPQVFRAELLLRACASPENADCLDDAEAVRRSGGRVAVVPSEGPNVKITVPADLAAVEELLAH